MKSSVIVFAGAALFLGATFANAQPTNSGLTAPAIHSGGLLISECATGFTKTNPYQVANGDAGWTCVTPVVACPAPAPGKSGALLGPTGTPTGTGAQFSYKCAYRVMPK